MFLDKSLTFDYFKIINFFTCKKKIIYIYSEKFKNVLYKFYSWKYFYKKQNITNINHAGA